MDQSALFHESINDALRDIVKHCGGVKRVSAEMRPDLTIDNAGRWLADCLNDDRREKLSPDQVVYLLKRGRAIGSHEAMAFIAMECGYSTPQPVEPEDERAALQRQYIEAAKSMARIADRIEQMAAPKLARACA